MNAGVAMNPNDDVITMEIDLGETMLRAVNEWKKEEYIKYSYAACPDDFAVAPPPLAKATRLCAWGAFARAAGLKRVSNIVDWRFEGDAHSIPNQLGHIPRLNNLSEISNDKGYEAAKKEMLLLAEHLMGKKVKIPRAWIDEEGSPSRPGH